MTQFLRWAACSGISLTLAAFLALAGTAHAQGEVTVGGVVEVIGGISDSDGGSDGLSRGLFSRINVGYRNTLDNGLEVTGTIAYQVNQRGDGAEQFDASEAMDMAGDTPMMLEVSDTTTNYAPDLLSVSVGGGFGTISVGAHALASCALLPRPIAFVPGGVNTTWYTLFTDFDPIIGVFTESNYCTTSEAISYATPTVSGLQAMFSYAPNFAANQGTSLETATADSGNQKDYMAGAATFTTAMGGMDLTVGASFQTSDADTTAAMAEIDSTSVAATLGMRGATLGFSWHDNGTETGYTVGAKYSLGNMTPAITYSVIEQEDNPTGTLAEEETALVIGANYAVGGGLSIFAEYMTLESENTPMTCGAMDNEICGPVDDDLLMAGIIVSF